VCGCVSVIVVLSDESACLPAALFVYVAFFPTEGDAPSEPGRAKRKGHVIVWLTAQDKAHKHIHTGSQA